ncbi:tyrosine-type recombinase/integrase [Mycobacterium kansasii]|uniref:tyrosine-type recombinase/integrase n=1 Tax=Mycobacterium kansasii TaxID=1768 RepID=UPI0015E22748|nr:tyrosine-type recombinase/integrase [Mycobacterium kansasii]
MFVVVDRTYTQHPEAGEYLLWLRDRDMSPNTQRMYASRIARFLSSCDQLSVDWRQLDWDVLRGYRDQLVHELLERGGQRKASTVNSHMRCVVDFCIFAVHMGWMPPELVRQLQARVRPPKTGLPASGYRDSMLVTQPLTSVLKLREAKSRPRTVEYEHLDLVAGAAVNARDRFLVVLLLQTGLRIGEALGLRRNDLHFLPDSRNAGCRLQGPHLHIERRVNPNGALAKSRNERTVPVTAELVDFYVDMMLEKVEAIPAEHHSDMVFVNTFREPLGDALSYDAIRYIFDAISTRVGYRVTPHVLRHTCASHWLDHGTDRDVVQELLGHAAPQSTEIYLHPRSKRLREAVERASWRVQRVRQ